MSHRRLGILGAVAIVPALLGSMAGVSLARLSDGATSTGALGTDTLDPPTGLAATGGANASLTWTATVDTYASGYELQRGTVSGGPYSVISATTPRPPPATTDTPASNGTYYYVLRSVFQNWTSGNGNQA